MHKYHYYKQGELLHSEFFLLLMNTIDNVEHTTPFFECGWFKCWIASLQVVPAVFVMHDDEKPVGLVVIGENSKRKSGIVLKTAFINQTGEQLFDQPWIEYNDILCIEKHKKTFINRLFIILKEHNFDRVLFSMLAENAYKNLHSYKGKLASVSKVSGFTTDLSMLNKTPFPQYLSKNTKAQLKRSNKKIAQKYGDAYVSLASEDIEKQRYVAGLSRLHIKRWMDTRFGSGFNNSPFIKFVNNVVFDKNCSSEVVKVQTSQLVLGYSLNLIVGDTVYFYCSGINHTIAKGQSKPGYTMHYLIMKHYAERGYKKYDFLGGEARYKRSLCSEEVSFWCAEYYISSIKAVIAKLYRLASRIIKCFN